MPLNAQNKVSGSSFRCLSAFDRYAETGGPDGGYLEEDNPDSGADREDADRPAFRREDPEPDLEPWLCRGPVRP